MSEPIRVGIGTALARLVERSPQRPVERDDQRGWFFLAAIQVGVTIVVAGPGAGLVRGASVSPGRVAAGGAARSRAEAT
jgi:hypothetical protein